jgi:hypothetical protein
VDVVAIVALARNADDEAPVLAAELGLTVYEAALMLRAAPPIVVGRFDDRARALSLLAKLRARGHDTVACDVDAVVPSERMFRPRTFRFEGGDLIATGGGEERRLPSAGIVALVRATHVTRTEETATKNVRQFSLGRAAMTGGLVPIKSAAVESRRVVDEREAVLYVFRADAEAWLFGASGLRYEGLGAEMRRSQAENFEVLVRTLRDLAPIATYDARLLSVRSWPSTVLSASAKQLTASSSATIDLLAHLVAMTIAKSARPYR